MSLYPELDSLSIEELIARYHGPAPAEAERPSVYYDAVAWRLYAVDDAGIVFLRGQLEQADETRLPGILSALSRELVEADERPWLVALLLRHLDDRRTAVAVRAMDCLAWISERSATAAVLARRDHPDPEVRAAVLRFMQSCHRHGAKDLLLAALSDPAHEVRTWVVDCLEEMEPKLPAAEYVPQLLPLLEDPHRDVRQSTILALGKAGDPALRPVLQAFVEHEDPVLRATAEMVLLYFLRAE